MNSTDGNGVGGYGPGPSRPGSTSRPNNTKWVERAFSKRDCARFVASTKDPTRCACGQTWVFHKTHGVEAVGEPGEVWGPAYHTAGSPTDSYGTIDFLGGPHPNKAQFIRLGFDSRPDLILQLLTREWGLELPKLIISVHGGKANFDLNSRLKKVLRKGLLRAAKTTGSWILTGGTNTGVTKHVGDALISERSPRLRGGRVVSIGIAPWGVVENRAGLIGRNKDVTYLSIDQPRSKFAVLNNRHAYFLLADNGTVGRYGAEIALRRKLEKYISSQRLSSRTYCSIPVVCVVIEGGMHTIRTVLEYVTDSPPVPVVVVEGSGRAADLLAFTYKYAADEADESISASTLMDGMREQLIATIQRTFAVDHFQAEKLLAELLQCVKKRNLITIFRPSDSAGADITGDSHELDHAILSALFRSRHLSASEQLSLALAWNRVDIARSEIFVYGQEWADGALEEAMMEALIKNRVDFVKLLLETGVQMAKFLTIPRLEELYNSKQGPANTLGYIVRDVRPHMPHNYAYTLVDIGLVMNKLMGGAYRCSYTRRKFRAIYTTLMHKKAPVHHGGSFSSAALARVYSSHLLRNGFNNQSMTADGDTAGHNPELSGNLFAQPFNELLVWSVLTKRQAMAKLMWHHGEEALAKALVASKLYRAMASEAADDDLEVGVYEELRRYSAEFDREALDLLDYCYRQDDDLAQQLLTCELSNWSRQTCLRLAVACHHRQLLSHPCAQLILGDLWLGGLRTRKSSNVQVVLGLICPPWILRLDFKTKKELQLMPQTEEEHMIDLKGERDEYTSSDHSSSSSSSSSPSHSPRSERSLSHRRISVIPDTEQIRPRVQSNASTIPDAPSRRGTVGEEIDGAANTSKDNFINGDPAYMDFEQRRRMRQLRLKRKFYEFYAAPITKFWSWSMAYFLFLIIYTYTVLIKTPDTPAWNEIFIISYIMSFGCEKVREILASEPVKLTHKIRVWAMDMWNACDALFVVELIIALIVRLQGGYLQEVGRVLYCLNIVYWYIRILRILQVSKFLGPFVTMIGSMLEKMAYYVTLMLVVLMSYGVFRQSILYPHEDFSWWSVRDIFFKPYFMIYGELFADSIDPKCEDGDEFIDGKPNPEWIPCETGRWLNPLLMTCYLLVSNILLLNLLIAVFNSIFLRTHVFSHQIWKFNRFGVVMEYEQKPALPPPLIIFSHLYLIIKWCRRRSKGMIDSYDYGLKLFLDKDDLERLYDFEEESMEGLVRERETQVHLSTEERVRLIGERLDGMGSKMEDSFQKSATQNDSLQSLDFRLMRLEEASEQINASLAVIHRFMAFQRNGNVKRDSASKSSPNLPSQHSREQQLHHQKMTADEFRRHLTVDPTLERNRGRRSSCIAFDPELDEEEDVAMPTPTPLQLAAVQPQDLAMLRSMGSGSGMIVRPRQQRTFSETSNDGHHILRAMDMAGLSHIHPARTPGSDYLVDDPSSPQLKRRNRADEEDDFGTTAGMASLDLSDRASLDRKTLGTTIDDDEEITEVFEHADERDDIVDSAGNILIQRQLRPGSDSYQPLKQRSYSVGGSRPHITGSPSGDGEIRKRSRNWSGTATSNSSDGQFVSPRGSRRSRYGKSPVSPTVMPEENVQAGPDSSNRQDPPLEHKRARLQSMHSCPSGNQQSQPPPPLGSKWTASSNSCQACQVMRGSFSVGSFPASKEQANTQQPPIPPVTNDPPIAAPKINQNILPTAPSGSRSRPNPPAAAKVEAEAEHLREIEGQDYHMMEGIIRRRLHRNSEDLDVSLEDLCNAPILLDETLDSLEEVPETQEQGATAFIVGDSSGESEVEIQPQLSTQKRQSVPNIFSAITATMLTTMGTITGKNNDPSEGRKKSSTDKVPIKKMGETETAASTTRGPTGQSPLPSTGFAMGTLPVKEANVTINVEEDQC